jgi:hypothetical protein
MICRPRVKDDQRITEAVFYDKKRGGPKAASRAQASRSILVHDAAEQLHVRGLGAGDG